MMGVGMVMMVSGLYGSYGIAGALMGANALAWAGGNAMLSRLVDRFGQARIMVPATVLTFVAMAALVVVAWLRMPVLALFPPAIVCGAAQGSASAMVLARWTHHLGDSPKLHTAFSLEATLNELSYIIGPVVATFLAVSVHATAGVGVSAALVLVGGLWLFGALRATQPPVAGRPVPSVSPSVIVASSETAVPPGYYPRQEDVPVSRDAQRPAPSEASLRRKTPSPSGMPRYGFAWTIAPIVTVTAMFGLAFGSVDVAAVAATKAWGSPGMAGIALAAMSLGSAVAGLAYGARHWTSSLPRRYVIGAAIYALLTAPLLLAHTVPVLVICGFLAGSAVAPSLTNANSLVRVLVPKHRLTEGLAWVGTFIGIGAALGSAIAGRLIDDFGYTAGYLTTIASTVCAFLAAAAGYRMLSRRVAVGSSA